MTALVGFAATTSALAYVSFAECESGVKTPAGFEMWAKCKTNGPGACAAAAIATAKGDSGAGCMAGDYPGSG